MSKRGANEFVMNLLSDWANGKIDQDEFDETLDTVAEYRNDIYLSVDSYFDGVM